MKYHIKNKISKKSLKKLRMKPLPLMRVKNESERIGAKLDGTGKNILYS